MSVKKQKKLFEIVRWSRKRGTQLIIINGLTEAKGKKILAALPENDLYMFTMRLDSKALLKNGLKAPATKGLRTLCAKNVGVTGLRKKDGTQKKGYIAKKGGKLVKSNTRIKK